MSSVLLFVFGRQNDIAQMPVSLRCYWYGNKFFTRPAIHVFGVKFVHGHESVVDEEGPGRRVFSTTDTTNETVDSLIRSD